MFRQLITKVAQRFHVGASQFDQDARAKAKAVAAAGADFIKLYESLNGLAMEVAEEYPLPARASALKAKEVLNKRGKAFVAEAKDEHDVITFLNKYLGSLEDDPKNKSRHASVIYWLRDAHLKVGFSLDDAVKKVQDFVRIYGFENVELATSQANIRDILPDQIRTFLPRNIVIETDPNGEISKMTDRFGNKNDTLDSKLEGLKILVKNYNAIVKKVKKDLLSNDENIRLGALITWIMLETGIRPGRPGARTLKKINGEDVEIETFGARSLLTKHINFVSDDFVILKFPGKKLKENEVGLRDTAAIKVLMEYAERALSETGDAIEFTGDASNLPIFRRENGTAYPETALRTYFRARVNSKLTPKNLRQLKATNEILENLYVEQKKLYKTIRKFVEDEVDDLKSRITDEVVKTIQKSIGKAQEALHHETSRLTVDYYASPQVVLNFLSSGRIENSLTKVVLENKPSLRFDPNLFLEQALKKTASMLTFAYTQTKRAFTLLDILGDLEESIKENASL